MADVIAELVEATPRKHQLLAAAFAAAGGAGVKVALGDGSVLATSVAIDLLDDADHAALRVLAHDVLRTGRHVDVLRLTSGEDVDVRWIVADGVEVVASLTRRSPQLGVGQSQKAYSDSWPVLVIGERGSGRTTKARDVIATPDVTVLDGIVPSKRRNSTGCWVSRCHVGTVAQLSRTSTFLANRRSCTSHPGFVGRLPALSSPPSLGASGTEPIPYWDRQLLAKRRWRRCDRGAARFPQSPIACCP